MVDDLKKVVAESRTAAGVEIIKEVVKGMKEILLTFLELSQAHRVRTLLSRFWHHTVLISKL